MSRALGPQPRTYFSDPEDKEDWLGIARKSAGLKPIEIKKRDCIKCDKKFKSEGAHNRMCQWCRNNYKE